MSQKWATVALESFTCIKLFHPFVQAATATPPPGSASDPPRAGDGFTFEHLADRPQLWLDFCADTGDGGDPTYAVARAMAAPGLKVHERLTCILAGEFNQQIVQMLAELKQLLGEVDGVARPQQCMNCNASFP